MYEDYDEDDTLSAPQLEWHEPPRRTLSQKIIRASLVVITLAVVVSSIAVTFSYDFAALLGRTINVSGFTTVPQPHAQVPTAANHTDWTMFLHDDQGWNYNPNETIISPASAKHLALVSAYSIGKIQPINDAIVSTLLSVGNILYFGSWNGTYYAINSETHHVIWKHTMPIVIATKESGCQPPRAGISSKATYVNGVLYFSGSDGFAYALDAKTGKEVWKVHVATPPNEFLWGAPAVGNQHVYVPVASYGDCPLIPGRLVMVDQKTGKIGQIHWTEKPHFGGVTIWNKPLLDAQDHSVFYATGSFSSGPESGAIVELDWNTLAVKSIWSIPPSDVGFDNAFGASCNLLPQVGQPGQRGLICHSKATRVYGIMLTPTGMQHAWTVTLGRTDGESPEFANADAAECSYDTHLLYCGGTRPTINGVEHAGGIFAIDPITGTVKWGIGVDDGYPLSALTVAHGVVAIALANVYEHGVLLALNAADGSVLYRFPLTVTNYASPIIVNGKIYVTTADGRIFVFGILDHIPADDIFTGQTPANQWQWINHRDQHARFTGHSLQIDAVALYHIDSENFLYEQIPSGDFTVTTQIHFAPTSQYEQAGVVLWQDGNNYIKLDILATSPGHLSFEFTDHENDGGHGGYTDDPFPPETTVLLQIVRLGDTYLGYVSGDGGSVWRELNTLSPGITPRAIGIGASTNHPNVYQAADFLSCVVVSL